MGNAVERLATSSSNRSTGTSITSPLSQAFVRVGAVESGALLDGLNDAQRQAVTTDAAPLCILAGAGLGQDPCAHPPHRLPADRTADARHVLALTFTRKAAGELAGRLRRLGLRDHRGGRHVPRRRLRAAARRWADRGIAAARAARAQGSASLGSPARRAARRCRPLDVVAEIEWAKARLVTPDAYADAAARAARSRRRSTTGAMADAVPALRGREAPATPWSTSTTCCGCAAAT